MIKGLILICAMAATEQHYDYAKECDELTARARIPIGNKHPTVAACERFGLMVQPQFAALLGPNDYFKTVCRQMEREVG